MNGVVLSGLYLVFILTSLAREMESVKKEKLSNAYNILAGLITIPKLLSSCHEIEIYPLLSPFISLWIIFRWFKQKKKQNNWKKIVHGTDCIFFIYYMYSFNGLFLLFLANMLP